MLVASMSEMVTVGAGVLALDVSMESSEGGGERRKKEEQLASVESNRKLLKEGGREKLTHPLLLLKLSRL